MNMLAFATLLLGVAVAFARSGFVRTSGASFTDDSGPFRYAGTNVYYGHYSPQFMVDDVFGRAAANNFSVIRVWAFLDVGRGGELGSAFQYWDTQAHTVAVNTTALNRLDYLLARAAQLGLRLILTLTNNWSDFGGMDQHGIWRKNLFPTETWHHDDFYDDSTVKAWYKQFAGTLINRTNSINGVRYAEDPTIFSWQLANEPRCVGSTGGAPTSKKCVTRSADGVPSSIITSWVVEMSAFIKSLDPNHLVSVGDEGFYCAKNPNGAPVNMYDCSSGGDNSGFLRVPTIDYSTAHLYPESWGSNVAWGTEWIQNHTTDAHAAGKPFVVEEYGLANNILSQDSNYKVWTDAVEAAGTNADHHWMIAGLQSPGGAWYNGGALDVICRTNSSDPVVPRGNNANTCAVLHAHALRMASL